MGWVEKSDFALAFLLLPLAVSLATPIDEKPLVEREGVELHCVDDNENTYDVGYCTIHTQSCTYSYVRTYAVRKYVGARLATERYCTYGMVLSL